MKSKAISEISDTLTRRGFLQTTAATSALLLSPMFADTEESPDDLNVALIGAGAQGSVLVSACLKIPGIRFRAVCDIWEEYALKRISKLLGKYHHSNNAYVDHHEMLEKEKDLDAVIIATPDFWHARQTVDCLNAGLHVYCEKEMSNNLEDAERMVQTARETGKLLQIGHQRRSNPRYVHCRQKLLQEMQLLGRITTIYGQWNRGTYASMPLGYPKGTEIESKLLQQYGYDSMYQFRNWRRYARLGAGLMGDLGSHQIDVYSWFLGANPKMVMARGGVDYWEDRELPDSVMATYEYDYEYAKEKKQTVAAFYQVITTNRSDGYYEKFMGDQGTLVISERPGLGRVYQEAHTPLEKWEKCIADGYIEAFIADPDLDAITCPSPPCDTVRYDITATLEKPIHQPHLENFFNSIRGKEKLNCPGEVGYETCVAILKTNEAVEAKRQLEFTPGDFRT